DSTHQFRLRNRCASCSGWPQYAESLLPGNRGNAVQVRLRVVADLIVPRVVVAYLIAFVHHEHGSMLSHAVRRRLQSLWGAAINTVSRSGLSTLRPVCLAAPGPEDAR